MYQKFMKINNYKTMLLSFFLTVTSSYNFTAVYLNKENFKNLFHKIFFLTSTFKSPKDETSYYSLKKMMYENKILEND